MTADRHRTLFREALRALDSRHVDGGSELCRLRVDECRDFLSANMIVRRVSPLLRAAGAEHAGALSDLESSESNRVGSTLRTAADLQAFCERHGTPVVFPKALQHYPDMGHDVDLWMLESASVFDPQLCRAFDATAAPRGVFDRVAGTRVYTLATCPSPLEIHHGGVGHLGEHRGYLVEVLARRRQQVADGMSIAVPSDEDQLIIQAMQRMFTHFSVRVSDVHLTAGLVGGALDWAYIQDVCRRFGLTRALSMWVSLARQLWEDAVGRAFPAEAIQAAGSTPVSLTSRGHLWRIGVLATAPRLYGGLALHALRWSQWRTLGRLAAIPAAVAACGILAAGRPFRQALASRSGSR
jgi:hypothetical protein